MDIVTPAWKIVVYWVMKIYLDMVLKKTFKCRAWNLSFYSYPSNGLQIQRKDLPRCTQSWNALKSEVEIGSFRKYRLVSMYTATYVQPEGQRNSEDFGLVILSIKCPDTVCSSTVLWPLKSLLWLLFTYFFTTLCEFFIFLW